LLLLSTRVFAAEENANIAQLDYLRLGHSVRQLVLSPGGARRAKLGDRTTLATWRTWCANQRA
jgi:hypothetical protein